MAFSYINLAPAGIFNAPMEAASAVSMGYFTLFWGLIATALTVATLKIWPEDAYTCLRSA
ncbi:MAG: hypothetical protein R2741_12430 [Methanolobus sp.]